MMIAVASKNTVKLESVRRGFERMFPGETCEVAGISVPSGVSDQPMGDEETQRGAQNRLQAIKTSVPEADLWVAIEGGCAEGIDGLETFAWIFVETREGQKGKARTAAFYLPQVVAELVRSGVELGLADDRVFGRQDSKQQNGSVGLLTGDVIDRTEYYAHAVILALIPLKNKSLFS